MTDMSNPDPNLLFDVTVNGVERLALLAGLQSSMEVALAAKSRDGILAVGTAAAKLGNAEGYTAEEFAAEEAAFDADHVELNERERYILRAAMGSMVVGLSRGLFNDDVGLTEPELRALAAKIGAR